MLIILIFAEFNHGAYPGNIPTADTNSPRKYDLPRILPLCRSAVPAHLQENRSRPMDPHADDALVHRRHVPGCPLW
jgi:hypothetical protein